MSEFLQRAEALIRLSMDRPDLAEQLYRQIEPDLKRIGEEFQRELQRIHSSWEKEFGTPYPQTRSDWRRWCTRLGMQAGAELEQTPAELMDYIEGYLLRLKDKQGKTSPLAAASSEYGPNEERDRWLYDKWQTEKLTWNAIHTEFKRVRKKHSWQAVEVYGVRKAVERFAIHHKLPLRRGRGGAPMK